MNGEATVPTLLKPVHLVLEGWLTTWLLLWKVTEPCRSHGGRIGGTVDHPVNSGRIQQTVALINLPHSSFTVREDTTVKEVRLHSERGKATMARVVGIVATMPYYDIEVTMSVMSQVRVPCVGSLALICLAPEPWRGSGET